MGDQQKKGAGIALYGHQLVSKRCAGLNKQSCKNKLGCNWSLVPGDEDLPKADPSTSREKCVDAASWRCGVKKNFVDCVQHNKYGPSYVNWKFDSLCSGVMFDEKPKKRKLCSKGIRKRETCESNQDCPIFTGGGHAECKEYSAVAGCHCRPSSGAPRWDTSTSCSRSNSPTSGIPAKNSAGASWRCKCVCVCLPLSVRFGL